MTWYDFEEEVQGETMKWDDLCEVLGYKKHSDKTVITYGREMIVEYYYRLMGDDPRPFPHRAYTSIKGWEGSKENLKQYLKDVQYDEHGKIVIAIMLGNISIKNRSLMKKAKKLQEKRIAKAYYFSGNFANPFAEIEREAWRIQYEEQLRRIEADSTIETRRQQALESVHEMEERFRKIVESVRLPSPPGEEIDWKDCEAEYGEDNRKQ